MSPSRYKKDYEKEEEYKKTAEGFRIKIFDENIILQNARYPLLAHVIFGMKKIELTKFIDKYGKDFVDYVCESPEWGTRDFDDI